MFSRKLNILVTGANGQLGSYLVKHFRDRSMFKSSRINKVYGIDIDDLDITSRCVVNKFFDGDVPLDKIDYVIHCAAATDTAAIEKDPNSYYAANCLGTRNLVEACAKHDIKFIFISTDYVLSELSPFDGDKLQEFPVNQYGLQKLIAEMFVKDAYKDRPKDYMVLRSSWMYGNSSKSFVEKFLVNAFTAYSKIVENCATPAIVKVADDVYGRPTPVWFIVDSIESFIHNRLYGTYDLQYPTKQISRFDWATMIWNAFIDCSNDCNEETAGIARALKDHVKVVPCKSCEFGPGMKHPGEVMNSTSMIPHEQDMYMSDTTWYVHKNWNKYIDMAKDIIGKKA